MKKMKFLLSLVLISFCCVAETFANVEIDVHFLGNFYDHLEGTVEKMNSIDVSKYKVKGEVNPEFSFGVEDNVAIFFGSSPKKLDIGLSLISGFSYASKTEAKLSFSEISTKGKYNVSDIDFWLGAGPAFRYSFNQKFSLCLHPDFVVDFRTVSFNDYSDKIVDVSFGANFNLGGRYWLVNKNGFHFGIDGGVQFGVMGTVGKLTEDFYDIEYTGTRVSTKFHLGVCFNIGDRGIDRF